MAIPKCKRLHSQEADTRPLSAFHFKSSDVNAISVLVWTPPEAEPEMGLVYLGGDPRK